MARGFRQEVYTGCKVAIPVPEESKEQILDLVQSRRPLVSDVRINISNRISHVTALSLEGSQRWSELNRVKEVMVRHAPILIGANIEVRGVDVIGGAEIAYAVLKVVGCSTLVRFRQAVASDLGYRLEDPKWKAHLTLVKGERGSGSFKSAVSYLQRRLEDFHTTFPVQSIDVNGMVNGHEGIDNVRRLRKVALQESPEYSPRIRHRKLWSRV